MGSGSQVITLYVFEQAHVISVPQTSVLNRPGLFWSSLLCSSQHWRGKPKPDTSWENRHMMMMSSCTCVHWVTPWGGEGREGRETPKTIPYVRLPDPLG